MKTKNLRKPGGFITQFFVPNYNPIEGDGFFQTLAGLYRRVGEHIYPVECRWKPDVFMRFALVDQWGFAHQWQ